MAEAKSVEFSREYARTPESVMADADGTLSTPTVFACLALADAGALHEAQEIFYKIEVDGHGFPLLGKP